MDTGKHLWRTKDWRLIAKDRLHPIKCDHCPCNQCVEVGRLRAEADREGWDLLGPGVIVHREYEIWSRAWAGGVLSLVVSDFYSPDYESVVLECAVLPDRKFKYVDCDCTVHAVDMDLEVDQNSYFAIHYGENPIVNYRKHIAYGNGCACFDMREVVLTYPELFGVIDVLWGAATEIYLKYFIELEENGTYTHNITGDATYIKTKLEGTAVSHGSDKEGYMAIVRPAVLDDLDFHSIPSSYNVGSWDGARLAYVGSNEHRGRGTRAMNEGLITTEIAVDVLDSAGSPADAVWCTEDFDSAFLE